MVWVSSVATQPCINVAYCSHEARCNLFTSWRIGWVWNIGNIVYTKTKFQLKQILVLCVNCHELRSRDWEAEKADESWLAHGNEINLARSPRAPRFKSVTDFLTIALDKWTSCYILTPVCNGWKTLLHADFNLNSRINFHQTLKQSDHLSFVSAWNKSNWLHTRRKDYDASKFMKIILLCRTTWWLMSYDMVIYRRSRCQSIFRGFNAQTLNQLTHVLYTINTISFRSPYDGPSHFSFWR